MKISKIIKRIISLFVVTAFGTIGAGAVIGINVIQTAVLAGLMGVANVIQDLAKDYLEDGKLTNAEIDAAFAKNSPKK